MYQTEELSQSGAFDVLARSTLSVTRFMIRAHALFAALLALALTSGCGGCDGDPPAAPVDAGAVDAPGTDARAAWACACEPTEDCTACYRKIGECCYEDPEIGGLVELFADNCRRAGACMACCNECAAQTCEQLIASRGCPNMP